jgi:hypothetical protein
MRKAATESGSGASCSVLTRPGLITSVPEVDQALEDLRNLSAAARPGEHR